MFLYRDHDIALRLLEPRHAQQLFALVVANREHLAEWLPFAETTRTVEDTSSFIQASLRAFGEGRTGGSFGVWYQGELCGGTGFHEIDRLANRTEIGYWLSAGTQGKGIMTRSVRAMVDHAFTELRLHTVEIHVAPENTRSAAIPERLGFVQEGAIRQGIGTGRGMHDRVVYGMLAAEWE